MAPTFSSCTTGYMTKSDRRSNRSTESPKKPVPSEPLHYLRINLNKKTRIERGWKLFRFFREVAFVSFPWVAILPILGIILKIYPPSIMFSIGVTLFIVSIFLFCMGILWTSLWPCPRCRRPYSRNRTTNFPFLDKCRHCGLPFGAIETDSDVQQVGPPDVQKADPR